MWHQTEIYGPHWFQAVQKSTDQRGVTCAAAQTCFCKEKMIDLEVVLTLIEDYIQLAASCYERYGLRSCKANSCVCWSFLVRDITKINSTSTHVCDDETSYDFRSILRNFEPEGISIMQTFEISQVWSKHSVEIWEIS